MLSNLQLYGTEDVPPVPKELANERVALLRKNLRRELDKPFLEKSSYIQFEIIRAIAFWKKLSHQEETGL